MAKASAQHKREGLYTGERCSEEAGANAFAGSYAVTAVMIILIASTAIAIIQRGIAQKNEEIAIQNEEKALEQQAIAEAERENAIRERNITQIQSLFSLANSQYSPAH